MKRPAADNARARGGKRACESRRPRACEGRRPRACGGRHAFTLVEVLASLALVGVVLPTAMAGVGLAMGLGHASRLRTEATMLAQGKLAEAVATDDWQEGRDDGDFGDDWPNYEWEMDVDDWEEPGVSVVTVTVTWTARGLERSVALDTLAYAGEAQ